MLTTVCTLPARLRIRDQNPMVTEVASCPDEPHILVGRDVPNRHRLPLDGPRGMLEID